MTVKIQATNKKKTYHSGLKSRECSCSLRYKSNQMRGKKTGISQKQCRWLMRADITCSQGDENKTKRSYFSHTQISDR